MNATVSSTKFQTWDTFLSHILDVAHRVKNNQCSSHNQRARYAAAEGKIFKNLF